MKLKNETKRSCSVWMGIVFNLLGCRHGEDKWLSSSIVGVFQKSMVNEEMSLSQGVEDLCKEVIMQHTTDVRGEREVVTKGNHGGWESICVLEEGGINNWVPE